MKRKYLLLTMILFVFLFLFSTPSLALIPGDFDGDNVVGFEDLMIFAMVYGSCEGDINWNPVCDLNGDGCIEFEDLMIFAMHYGECAPPSAPILSDPGDTLTSPATYTVSWSAVTTATSYVLQEATSSDFTSGLLKYPLTDTSKDFSHTVTTTTTYYYRVAAINDCGQGGWSNVKDIDIVTCSSPPVTEVTALGFTYHSSYMSVVQSIINKLIKENRIHESYPIIPKKMERTDVVYEIYIEWAEYTEDKPNGYKVYKSIDGGSYQLIVEGDADAGYGYYSFTDTTVTEGSTYSYYITAYGSGWETCSSEPAITTVLPWCSLVSPLDGVTIKNNPHPDFSWSPVGVSTFPYGAVSYGDSDLQVKDTTTGGESWYILFNNMTLSTVTYDKDGQATPLVSGHSYTWNYCGYGYDGSNNLIAVSCSEDWGFDYCTAPSPPFLSDPGTWVVSGATYTVSWFLLSGATSYVLQEATSSDFSGATSHSVTGTSKSFSHTVSTTTTYYYRVATVNSCGQGGWSNIQDITVAIGPVHNLTKDTYYTTIQAALNAAATGDTIEVPDGTYYESITFPFGKKIILQSVNDASSTTIRGYDGSPTVLSYGSTEDTTLEGFTITHNSGENGRGIYISEGFLIIDNCTISGNSTDYYGGGIYNNIATLTITSSTISGNSAAGSGGGIFNPAGGTIDITSSTISDNTAIHGGGIFNPAGGTLTIASSTISGNSADDMGGGIYNNSGTSTITSSAIFGNTADMGGGILNGGTLDIYSSLISGNTADGWGGGIDNHGTIDITSSTISGNTADMGGGIFNYYSGTLTIASSTISGNSAARDGGGIFNWWTSTLTITGSIISGNNVTGSGGGIYLGGTGTITIGGNDASDTSNFNAFTDNKKDGIISAAQHICNSYGDCRSSYPNNYYVPN